MRSSELSYNHCEMPRRAKTISTSVRCMILICLLAVIGEAESQYRFDSWTTENGLPQVSVNSICQTRDGFIWITTFGGLVRYDGLRFQTFTTGNTKGLRTGRFLQLKEDGEGTLWISTEGQGVTRYSNGEFTTLTTENGLPDNTIQWLDLDRDGSLILETERQILR